MFSNLTIEYLFLFDCGVSFIEEGSFLKIKSLISLKIQRSLLKKVPKEVSNITGLLGLSFKSNKITQLDKFDIRSRQQSDLIHLDLSKNRLLRLHPESLKTIFKLLNLFLHKNRLTFIHLGTFDDLYNLQWINLSGNRIVSFQGIFDKLNPKKIILNINKVKDLNGTFKNYMYKTEYVDLSRNDLVEIPSRELAFKLPRLLELHLYGTKLKKLHVDQFLGLTSLHRIHLNKNSLEKIDPLTFVPLLGIKYIELSFNMLTDLQRIFYNFRSLETLRLEANRIKSLNRVFANLTSLTFLQISQNQLEIIRKQDFEGIKSLKVLDLYKNRIKCLPTDVFYHLQNLKTLNLYRNRIVELGTSLAGIPRLMHLYLTQNRITTLNSSNFPPFLIDLNLDRNKLRNVRGAFKKVLDLRLLKLSNNWIESLDRSSFPKNLMNVVSLQGNKWRCDCRLIWLLRNFQNKSLVILDKPRCIYPSKMKGQIFTNLTVDDLKHWDEDCPTKCKCYCVAEKFDVKVTVDCSSNKLKYIPVVIPLKTTFLNLSNNAIRSTASKSMKYFKKVSCMDLATNRLDSIENLKGFPSLNTLSLTNNRFKSLKKEALEAFDSLTHVKLSGNPWQCNCGTIHFRNWLLSNTKKIDDIRQIRCNGGSLNSSVIIELGIFDLCPEEIIILVSIAVFLGLLLIAALARVFYYQYSDDIKLWLYSKRIFSSFMCIKPADNDDESENKRFDAFIMYAIPDFEFVVNNLICEMESTHPEYNFCIQDKHFNPLKDDFENVNEAVKCSKRIVVILTDSSLNCGLCLYGFKSALVESLSMKMNKIMVVVVGNISETDNMHPLLKRYLEMSSYYKWSDEKFWEKFLFGLPRVTREYSAIDRRSLLLQEESPSA